MKKVVSFIILIMGVEFLLISCSGNDQKGAQKERFQFYYYPRKNVYLDIKNNTFLYSLDGAKTWGSTANTLAREPVTLGEKVIIYSDSSNIYINNASHRKLYGGILYNLAYVDSSLAAEPEITERKVASKKTAVAAEPGPQEKPKKGLKKFFDKIFGKHKKDKSPS